VLLSLPKVTVFFGLYLSKFDGSLSDKTTLSSGDVEFIILFVYFTWPVTLLILCSPNYYSEF